MKINDCYIPLLKNQDRYLVLYGGAGSGKSYFAIQKKLLRLTTEKNHRFLFVRKVARTLKESVFNITKALILDAGIYSEFNVNHSEKTFHHLPTGNEIICAGLDDPEKLKSIHGVTGIWVEEATELDENDLDQLDLRLRGATTNYKQIILTYNPISVHHWLKKRFHDETPANCTILQTTFRDNLQIDKEYAEVLESKAAVNENYYRIYKKGEWGMPETERPWAYSFSTDLITDSIKLNKRIPVYLAFDFNISPMTCTVHQFNYMKFYYTLDEFRSNNTGTEELCKQIINSEYGDCHLIITGDATGRNRSTIGGNRNNYMIIQDTLDLHRGQLKVPKSNPNYSESRTLTNSILARHPRRFIHPKCEYLIADLQYIEGNERDQPKPESSDMGHLLDGLRYMDNTFFSAFVRDARRLKIRQPETQGIE